MCVNLEIGHLDIKFMMFLIRNQEISLCHYEHLCSGTILGMRNKDNLSDFNAE